MAHHDFGNRATQRASRQRDDNSPRPPLSDDDKRPDSNESMEVIEISDDEEILGVRDFTGAQNSQLTDDNRLLGLLPQRLPVSNAHDQNELFSYNSAESSPITEYLPPTAERGLSYSLNNLNLPTFNNSPSMSDGARNSPSPSTSTTSTTTSTSTTLSCPESYEEDQWISRLKPLLEPCSREMYESPSIPVRKMANKLINLSRCLQTPSFLDLNCLNCERIPTIPVTGKCGHTRCMRCTVLNKTCPCGTKSTWVPRENTVIREIIDKMMKFGKSSRSSKISKLIRPLSETPLKPDSFKLKTYQRRFMPMRGILQFSLPRMPMSAHARYTRAQVFMSMELYSEAAPHLARAAASVEPCSRMARRLLNKTVNIICQERGEQTAWRELSSAIRAQSTYNWLKAADLECVMCTNPYRDPVSTPCGHTFCRCCIERSMYYNQRCALCTAPLDHFVLGDTRNNTFCSAILKCLDVPPLPLEPDIIPIVISYVAFPGMACPLFIKNFRHWLMILRILKSGSRRFGMLSYERDHTLADYGIILEIRDCVIFKDNQCIVSTIGISRFKVIERDVRDGCDVARIRPLVDVIPTEEEVRNIHMLTENIVNKALTWVENMKSAVREEIETAFGSWPIWQEIQEEWWVTPEGPAWLWWLVAILPLKKDGKVHILSTQSLLTRMLAVLRTFEVMDGSLL